jgi:hypothetical protein
MDFRKLRNRRTNVITVKAREQATGDIVRDLTLFGGKGGRRPDAKRAWKPRKIKMNSRLHYQGNNVWA